MIHLSSTGSSHPTREDSGAASTENCVPCVLSFNFLIVYLKCKLTAWSFLIWCSKFSGPKRKKKILLQRSHTKFLCIPACLHFAFLNHMSFSKGAVRLVWTLPLGPHLDTVRLSLCVPLLLSAELSLKPLMGYFARVFAAFVRVRLSGETRKGN